MAPRNDVARKGRRRHRRLRGQLVFVDTAALIALGNASDALNTAAVAVRREIGRQRRPMLTIDAVLTETAGALSGARVRHLAAPIVDAVRQSALFEVVHIDPTPWERGWALFKARHDKEWSLVDCLAVVVMTDRGVRDAFTSDHHFAQAGFTCLLPPVNGRRRAWNPRQALRS